MKCLFIPCLKSRNSMILGQSDFFMSNNAIFTQIISTKVWGPKNRVPTRIQSRLDYSPRSEWQILNRVRTLLATLRNFHVREHTWNAKGKIESTLKGHKIMHLMHEFSIKAFYILQPNHFRSIFVKVL